MSGKAFIDTNVLVYLFDSRDPAKQRIAGELLSQIAAAGESPVISTQVLQESYVALTSKLRLSAATAREQLERANESGFEITTVHTPLIWLAAKRHGRDKLSFWDALVLETALATGCDVLFSEDFQHGRRFGELQIIDPFRANI